MATQTGEPPLTLLYRKKIQAGGRWTTRHPFSITYEAVKNRPAQTWLLEIFTPSTPWAILYRPSGPETSSTRTVKCRDSRRGHPAHAWSLYNLERPKPQALYQGTALSRAADEPKRIGL